MKKITKILIVDDDIGICETIKDILDDHGFETCIANDGFQALDLCRKNEFNVILMDIKMPGINGVETFKEIKKIKTQIKVLMMTAFSLESLIQEALKEGAYRVLKKPFDVETIIECINAA